jgi:biotin operon repressor
MSEVKPLDDEHDTRAPNDTDATEPRGGELSVLVAFFKVLADETRLRMLGLLADGERSVEELATLLGLRAPTVSHHLTRLKDIGLVGMRVDGNTHYYRLRPEALRDLRRLLPTPERMATLALPVAADAWERKVLRDFLVGERLKEIPAARKKRSVILRWLAERFEPGRRYTEAEVNEVLRRHHEDVASLRRELIGERLLGREGGIYWRPEEPAKAEKEARDDH